MITGIQGECGERSRGYEDLSRISIKKKKEVGVFGESILKSQLIT